MTYALCMNAPLMQYHTIYGVLHVGMIALNALPYMEVGA